MGTEIMAEGASPGPEVVTGAQTGADISSSVEVVRRAGGIPESVKRQQAMKLQLGGEPPEQGKPEEVDKTAEGGTEEKKTDGENQEKKRSRRGSLFEQAQKKFEGLQDELEDVELTEDERSAFEKDLEESLADIVHLFNEGEQFVDEEGKKIGILTFFRDDVRRIYLEASAQSPPSSDSEWGPSPTTKNSQERIHDVYKALGWNEETNKFRYDERFWGYGDIALSVIRDRDGNPVDPRILKAAFKGMASFLAPKVALAIEKRLKGIPVDPKRDFGDLFLVDIERELEETNEEREQDRKEKRKRATAKERLHYNNWRERFDFTWAEDIDELRDTIHDWLEIFARQIPRESAEKVNESIQTGRRNAISALEAAAHRIGIEKGSTIYIELQDTIEGHVDAISGVEMQNRKGGLEAHTAYLEDFANNFNGHHDAIYLRPKSALIQHYLSRNDGEAFLGGPSTLEKPKGGDVKEHKSQKEWEAKMYAYSHELYISEDDFKNAVTQKAAFEKSVREEVAQLNIPADQIEAEVRQRIDQKMASFEAGIRQEVEELYLSPEATKQEIRRRLGEKLGRYGWYDTVEELLLEDSRGKEKARNQLGDYRQMTETIEHEVAALNLPPDQAKQEISQRVIEEIRKRVSDADEFNAAMADYQKRWNKRKEGLVKVEARTGVFRTIKERLDKRDGLFGKSTEERRKIIRSRIKDKMRKEKRYEALLTEIEAIPDQEAQDRVLWKWVKEFNDFRQKTKGGTEHDSGVSTPEPWFPTSWDKVRLSITKTGKLADRALTKDQLEAMIEEVDDPCLNLTDDQIRKQIRKEFIEDIKKEIGAEGITEDQVAGELRARLVRKESDIAKKINNVLFNQQQRLTDAVREYNINRVYAKFIGLEARLGGLTVRTLDKDGKLVMRTIASVARDIIKAKIDWEAATLEKQVEIHGEALAQKRDEQNNPVYSPEQIEEQKNKKRRELRRGATFGSVLALREIGIANDLALTEYSFYGHTEQIQAFTELVEWDHTDKAFLPEFLDRPRREEEATMNFLAQQYMDGKYLIIRDNPDLDPKFEFEFEMDPQTNQPRIDPETKKKVYKLDEFDMPIPKRNTDGSLKVLKWNSDHKEAFDRARVINSGGELALRDLFESRFMVSTSGGVKVADLISKVGDLGIRDLLWEYGCWDMREFQGFIKRRDEVELGDQSFWNIEKWAAPISYAQRLRGAIAARVFLVGGELKGIGKVLGLLNEPLNGAWRFRDEFFVPGAWLDSQERDKLFNEPRTVNSVAEWRMKMRGGLENNDATKHLTDITRDKLISLAGDIFKNVIDYMTAREYVRNRAGFAPKNWQYDNDLIMEGIFEEYAKRSPVFALANEILFEDPEGRKILAEAGDILAAEGDEKLGEQHLSYAPEGRTKAARDLFRFMLQGSTYHTLDKADSRSLITEGKEVRKKMTDKRNKLLAKIMSEDEVKNIEAKQAKLDAENKKTLPNMQAEFVALVKNREGESKDTFKVKDYNQKVDNISQKREELKKKNKEIRAEEVKIATDMNKIVQDTLDKKSQAGTLTNEEAELRSMIAGRRQELARMGAKPELGNIELEINRIINQYIDYQLHMQFPGEWYARVADIAA